MPYPLETAPSNFTFDTRRMCIAGLLASLLESAQNLPYIHEVMPEPFDITNHAGNLWAGALITTGVALAYAHKDDGFNEKNITLSSEAMSHFRRYGIAMICGATALVNCITETKWGVKHLPIAEWLGGTTPDLLDTIYSTGSAAVVSLAFWRRSKR